MKENQNAVVWHVDRHISEGRENKTAFREVDGKMRELSYGDLAEKSSKFAGALYREGIRREERVAMIMLDRIEFPIVFWGTFKAGAIPVPINTLLSSSIYRSILEDSRASLLIVSEELWETVKPATEGNNHLRNIVIVGETQPVTTGFEDFVKGAEHVEPVFASGDETAFWLYSSGSTGDPKGVCHIHSSLQATAISYGQKVIGIQEDDVVYSAAKMFFAYGLGNAMTFPLSVGATTLLLGGRPTPEGVVEILKQHDPSIFYCVPTLYAAINSILENSKPDFCKRLRRCISAGEALPREVGKKWQKFMNVEILDGVGSTELLHIFLSNRTGEVVYGSSGIAVPDYQVRLVDENDKEVKDGEIGELLVNGPSSAECYWNRRQKNLDTFQGHWTRTGDKYERTPEGRYIYCGRTDDMFKVSGIWLSPFEVEQTLVEHPSILEAAVVPWLDENNLEKPKAYIVIKNNQPDIKHEEIKEFVREKIGKWKYPRWIEIVSDLPKTATGKIQRFKLRQEAQQ